MTITSLFVISIKIIEGNVEDWDAPTSNNYLIAKSVPLLLGNGFLELNQL
jgi:hypothetical protein